MEYKNNNPLTRFMSQPAELGTGGGGVGGAKQEGGGGTEVTSCPCVAEWVTT